MRYITLPKQHSFFLFGPRGVGKSTLLKKHLPVQQTYYIDLLDMETEARFLQKPSELSEILSALPKNIKWVVIDEVQKIPSLLNEVHRQIEQYKGRCFALTGSSARKLKRGQANLLAGRAFTYHLYPLTLSELGGEFDLQEALLYGTLPKIFSLNDDEEKNDFLRSYAHTYLKEEILAEGLIRNLTAFRRFLPLAARENGNIISWSNLAQDIGLDAKTIRSYFEILEDTLVGFLLPAYHRSLRKRQKTHPKFYLFDPGVRRALADELTLPLLVHTSEYGRAFEHWVILELMRWNVYQKRDYTFSYFATNDVEIDLIIERPGKGPLLIEIKSQDHVKNSDLRALMQITKEIKGAQGLCICREKRKRQVENILVCPWQEGLAVIQEM